MRSINTICVALLLSPLCFAQTQTPGLVHWSAKLAGARAGTANARVLCIGDSTTWGLPYGPNPDSFCAQLATLANNSRTPSVYGLSTPYTSPGDSRWTIGAGWASANAGAAGISSAYYSTGGGGSITFTPGVNADSFYVYYVGGSGATPAYQPLGTFTAQATGGSPTSVPYNSSLSGNIYRALVTAGSAGTGNSVSISVATGNTAVIVGVEPFLSTKAQILIGNAGNPGTNTTEWTNPYTAESLAFIAAATPDLVVIDLGINDAFASLSPTTYIANMTILINTAHAAGADVILSTFPPSQSSSYSTYEALYYPLLQSLASSNAIPLVDIYGLLGGTYNAPYMYDGVHPNVSGYTLWANALLPVVFPFTVDASQVTATQAILTYMAPSAAACSLQVSESPTLSPLVHDVDPALFSGSNSDGRTGNTAMGLRRSFVVGTRRSDQASDGNLYSRALQANTTQYYSVNCSGTISTGQFTTANPALGNTFPEPPPFNAAGWGNYGWPTINWADKTVGYIDPTTGIQIKRMTGPGEVYGRANGAGYDSEGVFSYYTDFNGAWTSPQNITGNGSAPSQTVYATYSGANSDPIFVAWGSSGMPEGFFGFSPENAGGLVNSLDNVQLSFFGTATDSSAANRTVEFCLSFYDSGNTCNTPYYTVVLPASAPASSSTASAVYPASSVFPDGGAWQGWGTTARRNDISVYSGTFSATGSTVTNTTYLGEFNLNWKSGGKIFLQGSSPTCANNVCTISSVTNGNTLLIVQTLPSPISGSYYSLTSGAIVRKTTGTGTVKVSVSSAYTQSAALIGPNGGDSDLCSLTSVTVSYAADGVTPIAPVSGEFCTPFVAGNPVLYLLIPSTGETRYLSPVYIDTHSTAPTSMDLMANGTGNGFWSAGSFNPSNPNQFYIGYRYSNYARTVGTYVNQAPNVVVTAAYSNTTSGCNYQAYAHSLYPPSSWKPGQDTTQYWFQGPQWSNSCMTYNNSNFLVSANTDVDYRVVTGSPTWKPSMQSDAGTGIQIPSIRWGKVFVGSNPGGQNTATGLWVLDLATGALQFSSASLNGTFPQRWGVNHTTNIGTPQNTFGINNQNPTGNESNGNPSPNSYGRGPFRFTPYAVLKSGSFSSDTSLPTDSSILGACPTGIASNLVHQGAVGNNCITFQSQMACSAAPWWQSSGGTTLTGAATAAATTLSVASASGISTGSYLYITTANSTTYPGLELVYVSGVSGTSLTVQRSVNGVSTALLSGANVSIQSGSISPEARDYPCDHGPNDIAGNPVWGEPSPLQPGDLFNYWGQLNTFGEWEDWQIVSVTPLGGANYQFVASRFPTSESNYCVQPGTYSPQPWPSGWSGYTYPLCDAFNFVNTTNLGAGWSYNYVGGGHTAFGFSGSAAYGTAVSSSDAYDPYTVWYQSPIMSPNNPFLENSTYTVPSNVPFAGSSPEYPWQSYPSQLQFSDSDPLNARWVVDLHAMNPGSGTSQDSGNAAGSNFSRGTQVTGTTTVWKFNGSTAPYKAMPVTAYAGHTLLQDVSSPATGNVITDSTPWQFCYAYTAGECRSGSASGDVYMSVPQAGGQTNYSLGLCYTNWFDENDPCAVNLQYHGASIVQGAVDRPDPNGQNFRKISTGFMGPGIEFSFSAATMEPAGQWTLFSCNWCNGYRSDIFMAKLPPFPSGQPVSSNNFVPVSVNLGPSAAYDQARVRFGYVEDGGNPSNFYCTQRADACMTSSAVSPFAFVSEGAAWASCSSGCTITVPSIPGRVLYYVVDRRNSSSGQVSTSEMRISAAP